MKIREESPEKRNICRVGPHQKKSFPEKDFPARSGAKRKATVHRQKKERTMLASGVKNPLPEAVKKKPLKKILAKRYYKKIRRGSRSQKKKGNGEIHNGENRRSSLSRYYNEGRECSQGKREPKSNRKRRGDLQGPC